MTDPNPLGVAVNGYGVIGKRVADAILLQEDMRLAGISDVVTRLSTWKGTPYEGTRTQNQGRTGNTADP